MATRYEDLRKRLRSLPTTGAPSASALRDRIKALPTAPADTSVSDPKSTSRFTGSAPQASALRERIKAAPTAPREQSWGEWALDLPGRAAREARDIQKGLVRGAVEGVENTAEAMGELLGFEQMKTPAGAPAKPIVKGKVELPKPAPPRTVAGRIAEPIGQIAAPYSGASRALRAIRPATTTGRIAKGTAAGAAADYAAFDPSEPNLSATLNENLPEWARTRVTEWLATDPKDPAYKNRLRNAVEGVILGGAIEGAMALGRAARRPSRAAAEEPASPPAEREPLELRPEQELRISEGTAEPTATTRELLRVAEKPIGIKGIETPPVQTGQNYSQPMQRPSNLRARIMAAPEPKPSPPPRPAPAPDQPARGPLPEVSRKVFLGKHGQRGVVFPDADHARLFDLAAREKRAMAKGRSDPGLASEREWARRTFGDKVWARNYSESVVAAARQAKEGETVAAPSLREPATLEPKPEPKPEPPQRPPTEEGSARHALDFSGAFGGTGRAMGENYLKAEFDAARQGRRDRVETQVAGLLIDRGVVATPAQLRPVIQEIDRIRSRGLTGADYQAAIRDLLNRAVSDIPRAESPAELDRLWSLGRRPEEPQRAAQNITENITAPRKKEPTQGVTPKQGPAEGFVREFDPDEIEVDARTFQFKEGADERGVTERLQGVERWDQRLAGVGVVYEDNTGKKWIVDGHQRVALARRAKQKGQEGVRLTGYTLREADGVTKEQARGIAAVKNIAEGTGTPLDAAKVLRDLDEAGLPPLPPRSALVRQGRDLASLDDEAFRMVVNKVVPEPYAAAVGRIAPRELHVPALRVLSQTKPDNIGQAESIVRQVVDAGTSRATQQGLFGPEEITQSLFKERAQVLDTAAKRLRQDRQTFATLVNRAGLAEEAGNVLAREANRARLTEDEQAAELLARLATVRGPIGDELSRLAREVQAGGRSVAAAADELLGALRARLGRGGVAGLELGPSGRDAEARRPDAPPPAGARQPAGLPAPRPSVPSPASGTAATADLRQRIAAAPTAPPEAAPRAAQQARPAPPPQVEAAPLPRPAAAVPQQTPEDLLARLSGAPSPGDAPVAITMPAQAPALRAGAPLRAAVPESAPRAPRPVPGVGERTAPERAGNINLDRLDTPGEIKQALKDAAKANRDFMGARRGRISREDTQRLADQLGMTEKQLLSRRRGQAFNAEEALAARQLLLAATDKLLKTARDANVNDSSEALARFAEALTRHAAIQEQVTGLTAEAGRALAQFRYRARALPPIGQVCPT